MSLPTITPTRLAQASSLFFGGMGVMLGIKAYTDPHELSHGFGLPEEDDAPVNPFIYVCGSRSLVGGATLLYFGLTGNAKAVGATQLSIAAVGALDSYVTAKLGKKDKAWTHGIGTSVMAITGALLIVASERGLGRLKI